MISLFRVEVDDVLQRLLAYCTEFRRFVDAHDRKPDLSGLKSLVGNHLLFVSEERLEARNSLGSRLCYLGRNREIEKLEKPV